MPLKNIECCEKEGIVLLKMMICKFKEMFDLCLHG